MKYVLLMLLFIAAINPFSYAKYNWKKKNRLAAVGIILLVLSATVFPAILILVR